jgi:hypothetical protein
MVVALIERLTTGRWDPLVTDLSVHARLLVAIPLLLIAESVLHMRTQRCLERFIDDQMSVEGDEAVQRIARRAEQLRDAFGPELFLLILAIIASQAVLWRTSLSGFVSAPMVGTITPARAWYAFVALPLLLFLSCRAVWRWLIWSQVLWKVSRLTLRTVAIHPDRRGGLGFMCEPATGFAIYGAVLSVICAGAWATKHLRVGIPVTAFGGTFCVLVLATLALVFGPLFFFAPPLWRTRLDGYRQYDALALDYARQFHHRWIEVGDTRDLLGSSDIQSMADMSNSYEIVKKMKIAPIELHVVLIAIVVMVVPMIPLVLMQIPLPELLFDLGSAVMGHATE